MVIHWKRYGPISAAILLLLLLVGIQLKASLQANDGHLIYALDDAYIHMAMAKNLVNHGVLGVTPDRFTPASSSILWPLLLGSVYYVNGPDEWTPLVLNVIFAAACLIAMGIWLRSAGARPVLVFLVLAAVILFAPLTSLIFCGMEHNLHIFASILFIGLLWHVMTHRLPDHSPIALLLAASLVSASRYEGLFMVAMVSLILVLESRRRLAAEVAIAGAIPPTLYAGFSLSLGWQALPNSVLLKGTMPDFHTAEGIAKGLGLLGIERLFLVPHLVVLLLPAAMYLLLGFRRSAAGSDSGNKITERALRPILAVFLMTALLHLQFAQTGWFLRYEAYLVCLGLMLTGLLIAQCLPIASEPGHQTGPPPKIEPLSAMAVSDPVRHQSATIGSLWLRFSANPYHPIVVVILVAMLIYPLATRGLWALQNTVRATQNIYQQQYQMGLFLRRYYPHANVILNDIGAVCYLTEIHLMDLSGLADRDVARAIRGHGYTQQELHRLARKHDMRLAVTHRVSAIPQDWLEAARWQIPHNVVCRKDSVSLFAVDPADFPELRENLRAFVTHLPPQVRYQIAGDAPHVPSGPNAPTD